MSEHTYASAMAEAIHEVGRIASAVKHGHDVHIITQEVLSQLAYLQQQEKNQREYRLSQITEGARKSIKTLIDDELIKQTEIDRINIMAFGVTIREQENG